MRPRRRRRRHPRPGRGARAEDAATPGSSTVVLEAADRVGTGQTGSNSGVIHAGIYYAPGSLKARMCVAGARAMYELCERRGIAYERCGKLIVARDESELAAPGRARAPRARERRARPAPARAGGARRRWSRTASGASALHSPETGIVDFAEVARALADDLGEQDVPVVTGCGVHAIERARTAGSALGHAQRRDTSALRGVRRGGARRPAGAAGRRARRPAHHPLPRQLPEAAPRAPRRSCAG